MKIYVAGPYGRRKGLSDAECEANVRVAIDAGRALIAKGHIPFIPHLYHYVHVGWSDSPDEEVWLRIASSWIEHCDALLLLPGESAGAQHEVELALGKKVYRSIEEVLS